MGVTWFARTEAKASNRLHLAGATLVMLAGLGLLVSFPLWATGEEPLAVRMPENWHAFWAVMALLLGGRCGLAVWDPRPPVVQAAVKNCIFALIVIDAGACFAVQDTAQACLILLLLLPTMFLGRFIYST